VYASEVAYWPADGTANDVSGNNGHGILRNGTTFGPGAIGEAFRFDGENDFVEVPGDDAWNFGTGDFSIAFWTKFDSLPPLGQSNSYTMLMLQIDNASNFFQFFVDRRLLPLVNPNPALFVRFRNAGNDVIRFNADYDAPLDRWIHFAVVRENDMATLYVDGAPYATQSNISGSIANLSSPLIFGSDEFNHTARLNGLMDEIHFYNHALSSQNVARLAGIPECSSLMLYGLGIAILCAWRRSIT
jgi:hypothetical protein